MKILTGDEVASGDNLAYHIVYKEYPDFGPVKVTTLKLSRVSKLERLNQAHLLLVFLSDPGKSGVR